MKNSLGIIIGIAIGLVFGMFIAGIAIKVATPTMFFKEVTSTYDFEKTVDLLSKRINQQEGWHVTTIINQQQEVLENGGPDVGKVKIFVFET